MVDYCGTWTYSWISTALPSITGITYTQTSTYVWSFTWATGSYTDYTLGTPYVVGIQGLVNGVAKVIANFNMYFTCSLTSFNVAT